MSYLVWHLIFRIIFHKIKKKLNTHTHLFRQLQFWVYEEEEEKHKYSRFNLIYNQIKISHTAAFAHIYIYENVFFATNKKNISADCCFSLQIFIHSFIFQEEKIWLIKKKKREAFAYTSNFLFEFIFGTIAHTHAILINKRNFQHYSCIKFAGFQVTSIFIN